MDTEPIERVIECFSRAGRRRQVLGDSAETDSAGMDFMGFKVDSDARLGELRMTS